MVKLPSTPNSPGEAETERRTQFLHDFGALLSLWAELEMAMEVRIAQLTSMGALDASIVLGSLQSGTRKNILFSLLSERGDKATISAVKAAITSSKRNPLVHSQFATEEDFSLFRMYQREVKDAYVVTARDFTADTFHDHFLKFRNLQADAVEALGVTEDQIEEYARGARLSATD